MNTDVKNNVILAIGSNTEQNVSFSKAERHLKALFPGIVFSTQMWTNPIGMQSDMFLNELAFIRTMHGQMQIIRALKQLERKCGSVKAERSKNIIRIDIDVIQFNDIRLKEEDWEREYVKTLIKQNPFV